MTGDGLFFLCCRGLTVEFFATVVMFLHLGHVQAQSASVASALMTFVLGTPSLPFLGPVAWPNVLKLASSFCCTAAVLLLLWVVVTGDCRAVSAPRLLPPAVFARTTRTTRTTDSFVQVFYTLRPFGSGIGGGERELLIKVLSPRCWQNEQVETRTWPH